MHILGPLFQQELLEVTIFVSFDLFLLLQMHILDPLLGAKAAQCDIFLNVR